MSVAVLPMKRVRVSSVPVVSSLRAAWHQQRALLMCWPKVHNWNNYPFEKVIDDYILFLAAVAAQQPVWLLVDAINEVAPILRARLPELQLYEHSLPAAADHSGIHLLEIATDDCWIRDYGPMQVGDIFVSAQFDGWGKKFTAELDNAATEELQRRGYLDTLLRVDAVFEGGALESDGLGTVMGTRQSLLDSVRNSDPSAMEELLKEVLGAERLILLHNSELSGDDTDGHIDLLARFLNPQTIAYAKAEEGHPDFAVLSALEDEMRALCDNEGNPYTLVPVAMPEPFCDYSGEPVPATYLNFIVINGALLVPGYGQPERDGAALAALAAYYPDRVAKTIPAASFIHQGGSLHCMSMEVYA